MENKKKDKKKEDEQSDATKRKMIFKKYKGFMKSYMETANFKEPILILMKRSGKAEFYENANKTKFAFTDTEGNQKEILLNPSQIQTFDYGKKEFKGYICHEDFATPLPERPLMTLEMIQLAIDKTLNDIKKWKADELKATGQMYWKIFGGIALLIGMFILYKMVVAPPQVVYQTVQPAAEAVAANITQAASAAEHIAMFG